MISDKPGARGRSTAVGLLFSVSAACSGAHHPPAARGVQNSTAGQGAPAAEHAPTEREYQRVKRRFSDPRYQEMLGRALYSAHQTGGEAVEALMRSLFIDMNVSGSFDFDASVDRAGGIEAYKARMASYLTSDDVMARGTAALALAIAGDPSYVEPLVTLLRSRALPAHSQALEGYDRGMAMLALALLNADDYRAEIEAFKTSALQNESEGARAALDLMDR